MPLQYRTLDNQTLHHDLKELTRQELLELQTIFAVDTSDKNNPRIKSVLILDEVSMIQAALLAWGSSQETEKFVRPGCTLWWNSDIYSIWVQVMVYSNMRCGKTLN